MAPLAQQFGRLGEALRSGLTQEINAAVDEFAQAVGAARPDTNLPTGQRLGSVVSEIELPDAIRAACSGGGTAVLPKSPDQIAERLFPTAESDDQRAGGRGAVSALVSSLGTDGAPLLPVRTHIFFRNVQGVWACTDPQCTQQARQDRQISVGRLFDRSTTTCPCGSRVLELLYCDPCGDLYLGGYRRELPQNGGWLVVPDDPNIEKAPDHSANDRTYENYAVYWPSRAQPQTDKWTQDGVPRRWRAATLNPRTGTIRLATRRADATGWLYYVPRMHAANRPNLARSANNDRPSLCPHCDANWSRLENAAPIRTQRTGFQKIAQVLTDSLLREIAPPTADHAEDRSRKLVLFSDSRQDAAKLSVGVAKSHWLDSVRQVVVEAAEEDVRAVLAFQRRTRGEQNQMSSYEQRLALAFSASNPNEAAAILATNAGMGNDPSPIGRLTQAQLADRTLARAAAGVVSTQRLEGLAAQRLLNAGMNPGGVDRSVTWTELERERGEWQRLFDWDRSPPAFKLDMSLEEKDHRRRIELAAREAISETIFSGGKRDFESLLLGTVTFDPLQAPANDRVLQETADSVIRMLGKRRRIDTHRATDNDQKLPGYARRYISAVAGANVRDDATFLQEVTYLLTRSRAYDQGIIRPSFRQTRRRILLPMLRLFSDPFASQRRNLQQLRSYYYRSESLRSGKHGRQPCRLLPVACNGGRSSIPP
jgi:DEAD/DEAH box helicase domain-containing protein